MTTINEQFEQFADIQKQAFEPLKAFGGIAAETFELVARQNYAVFGDCVNFAVDQAQRATTATDANEYVGQQVETLRTFGEQVAARAQQFAEIAQLAGKKVEATGPVVVPVKKRATKKAA